jgi:hypothetical protein
VAEEGFQMGVEIDLIISRILESVETCTIVDILINEFYIHLILYIVLKVTLRDLHSVFGES